MKPTKFLFASKTILVNALLLALTMFYPPSAALVQAEPQMVVGAVAALNLGLRLVTREGVGLYPQVVAEGGDGK